MSIQKKILFFLLSSTIFTACTNDKRTNEVKQTKISQKKNRTRNDDINDSTLTHYNPANEDKWIASFVNNLHQKYHFNGNVLVAKNDTIIYEKAIGWADYLHKDSLSINSEFELASITKTFTGVAIMQLIEKGKLSLNDNVKKFFPNFPYDGITIKLLLSHRSGMMNYVYFSEKVWKDKKQAMSNTDVMNLIAEHKPHPYLKPDDRFHYNNSNFMVLGAIIEKVSNQKYADYMMENIFKPAGMKHTHVYSTVDFKKIPVDVVGHDRTWKYSVAQNYLDGPVGDKGVYSTLHDLLLYDKYLKNGQLLNQTSLDSAYTPRNKFMHTYFNYGYGWRIFQGENMDKVIYHTGWWHGFKHIYVRNLSKNIVVIFLSNLSNGSLTQLDSLYTYLKMPIIHKSKYKENAPIKGADED